MARVLLQVVLLLMDMGMHGGSIVVIMIVYMVDKDEIRLELHQIRKRLFYTKEELAFVYGLSAIDARHHLVDRLRLEVEACKKAIRRLKKERQRLLDSSESTALELHLVESELAQDKRELIVLEQEVSRGMSFDPEEVQEALLDSLVNRAVTLTHEANAIVGLLDRDDPNEPQSSHERSVQNPWREMGMERCA